jgi:hypothetical protein
MIFIVVSLRSLPLCGWPVTPLAAYRGRSGVGPAQSKAGAVCRRGRIAPEVKANALFALAAEPSRRLRGGVAMTEDGEVLLEA